MRSGILCRWTLCPLASPWVCPKAMGEWGERCWCICFPGSFWPGGRESCVTVPRTVAPKKRPYPKAIPSPGSGNCFPLSLLQWRLPSVSSLGALQCPLSVLNNHPSLPIVLQPALPPSPSGGCRESHARSPTDTIIVPITSYPTGLFWASQRAPNSKSEPRVNSPSSSHVNTQ